MSRSGAFLDDVEAILFDFDGTVADSIGLILESYRHATRVVFGEPLCDDILLSNLGRPLMEQMGTLDEERADELMRVYREHNLAHHDGMLEAYAGIPEVLADLASRGFRMGIVTSKGRALAGKGLDVLRLGGFFEAVVCLEDTDSHKPHPEPVLAGVEALGSMVQHAVYVGDSPFDIEAGRAAGVGTVGVTWGGFDRETIVASRPDVIVDEPRELLGLFGRARQSAARCAATGVATGGKG